MRSSGRNSRGSGSGGKNYRGAGNRRDEQQQRAGRPRPEERRYDVGGGPKAGPKGSQGGPKGGQGGPKGSQGGQGSQGGGPKGGGGGRGRKPGPARPREYEAQIEERNRARHDKPRVKVPKTFGEPEGERLQKVLARAGMGSRRACEDLIDQARVWLLYTS
ncbi:pseudouridine synthase, partial [Streptomyces albiflaviniger]|nr:pseudouridine synthase [Streptomyces albiflaviniger]